MKVIENLKYIMVGFILFFVTCLQVQSQNVDSLNLQKAIDLALQNNHLLNIKKRQIEEKKSKVTESKIKAFPTVIASSTYQYNQNLGVLTIPAGSFGQLPLSPQMVVPLPNKDFSYELNGHDNFNVGVAIYQPVTQLGKIKIGVDISKTDVGIAQQEEIKASLQLQQGVEKLYYGLLINQKQKEEAEIKLELAKRKLFDVESALQSGKTIDVNKAGLQANIADEEQNILKLEIQAEDYSADLKNLTGITSERFILEDVEFKTEVIPQLEKSKIEAESRNSDLKIAGFNQLKAKQAITAARWSYLPDLGIVAGYSYQLGNHLYPAHNPYVGANFKWNIQDIFSTRQQVNQRNSILDQAVENVLNTQKQLDCDIEKAWRKINQASNLIAVAGKVVKYRTEELKIQMDKELTGLNTTTDILTTKALLAKARADLLAAQLNYRLALKDLKILMGEM
jgi:outer membrane protein